MKSNKDLRDFLDSVEFLVLHPATEVAETYSDFSKEFIVHMSNNSLGETRSISKHLYEAMKNGTWREQTGGTKGKSIEW